jgi:Heparinase II/III-like protein.
VLPLSRAWRTLRLQLTVRRTAGVHELLHSVRSRLRGPSLPAGAAWKTLSLDQLPQRPLRQLCTLSAVADRLTAPEATRLLDGILTSEVRGVSMLGWYGPRPQRGPLGRIRERAVARDPRAAWEEHRLQHLPIAVLLGRRCGRLPEVEDFLERTLSGVLDSFSQTPGSLIPMEVGLRIVSLCLTADLSAAAGMDRGFVNGDGMKMLLAKHVVALRARWEWRPRVRGNHYLANVVGLIWGALYLDMGPDAIAPLCDELYAEGIRQILPDGGSFEGTTSYLRLALELIATTLLLVESARTRVAAGGYGQLPRIPELLLDRLRSARDFLDAVEVGVGSLLQIGDCDSGRCGALMLEPLPAPDGTGPDRAAAVEALATRECMDLLDGVLGTVRREGTVMSLRDLLPRRTDDTPAVKSARVPRLATRREPRRPPDQTIVYRIPVDVDPQEIRDGRMWLFERFGLWVFRSTSLHVAVRISATGDGITNSWHSHTDLLSMQLVVRGVPLLVDAGTFIYLGDRDARELFRGSRAHNSPCWPEEESQIVAGGPFRWISNVRGCPALVEHHRCSALMTGPFGTVGRQVIISGAGVEVMDRLWRSRRGRSLSLTGTLHPLMHYSPAYGEIR